MGSHLSILAVTLLLMAALQPAMAGIQPAQDYPETRASPAYSIIITEVLYDPSETETEGEWVELVNPWVTPIDVTGWTLSDQDGEVDFTFPAMTFPPAGIALVHVGTGTNDTVFSDSQAEFFMGKGDSILSNVGDDVLLCDSANATVDFISYGQWDGASVQPAPVDFPYTHSNASASEGYSLALTSSGALRQSVPTALAPNGAEAPQKLLLTEVHYYAWDDNEFVTIHNPLAWSVDISSWYISDQEGAAAFPAGTAIAPGCNLTAALNSTAFTAQTLTVPDFEYGSLDTAVADMTIIGTKPLLSNSGDEVMLLNNWGNQADAFVYGASLYSGTGWLSEPADLLSQGQISKRNLGSPDTNRSADWANIRPFVVGQSDFNATEYLADGSLELFVSPDSSFDAVSNLMDSAQQRIWLTVYEFTQGPLADRLISASGRGVEVRVFLEGDPVGGLTEKELFLARRITESGAEVRFMANDPDNDIHARYDFVHAKYAIVDSDRLLIMSENWGEYGVPLTGETGNRGWGAIITDPETAEYFATVFSEDWNPLRSDSVLFDSSHPLWNSGLNSTSSNPAFVASFPSLTVDSLSYITPILSPDTSLAQNTILGILGSATERVYVEEFYIYKHWGDRSTGSTTATPNLYLEAVIDAARRGCEVRILMDATYYNAMDTDPIDNDDTAAYVNAIALAEGLDLQAKMVNTSEHDFEKIHNKGLIADDNVMISSINWNLNSATCNRESGVIIRNSESADYFTEVFMDDWKDDRTAPFAHFGTNTSYRANSTVSINATTSSDNAGITNFTWRLEGQAICYGLYFMHSFAVPGEYVLNLTVSDAWGNVACYERIVYIVDEDAVLEDGNETGADDDAMTSVLLILLLIPIFIFLAILAVVIIKRR